MIPWRDVWKWKRLIIPQVLEEGGLLAYHLVGHMGGWPGNGLNQAGGEQRECEPLGFSVGEHTSKGWGDFLGAFQCQGIIVRGGWGRELAAGSSLIIPAHLVSWTRYTQAVCGGVEAAGKYISEILMHWSCDASRTLTYYLGQISPSANCTNNTHTWVVEMLKLSGTVWLSHWKAQFDKGDS